ncbi:DUF6941 family protein [Streptosporangium sp. NPDC050855]|uniref:DUF6941 family protein n=1 Tax=Streptosporangium sp. NPDC050855 TaxID=3366194 RepID=UPI00379AA6F3
MVSPIDVQLILCDAAVSDPSGKVHMLGAGWSVTGAPSAPHAVAVLLGIPWDRADERIPLRLELRDDDGHPVEILTPGDDIAAVNHAGSVEIGRPSGLAAGTTLDAAFSLSVPALSLKPGRYHWRLEIGDQVVTKSFTARTGR